MKMSLPKLISVCQALDAKQCTSLKKFTLMHVGKTSDLYLILDCVIKERNKLKSAKDVEEVAQKCEVKCSHKTFMNSLSQLNLYAEDWIALSQLNENKYEKDLLIQQWYNKNGLYNLSDQLVTKVKKTIDAEKKWDLAESQYKAELLFEHFFSNNPVKYQFDVKQYEDMIQSFDQYVSSMYILIMTELCGLEQVANKKLPELKSTLEAKISMFPPTELSENLLKLYNVIDTSNFELLKELKSLLLSNRFNVGSKLHYIVASNIINKSINFWAKGLHKEVKLVQELTEYGIDNNVFFSYGKLSVVTFHSLLNKISAFYGYQKSEAFINQYIEKVNTTNLIATKELAMAQNCFHNKNYKDIFKYTRRGDFDNFVQKTVAQGLHLIACFMERNIDRENYQNALQSSILFFKRNKSKLSTNLLDSYNNLIQLLKDYDKATDNDKINVDNYKPLMYRNWCNENIK